jgi:hypothetical protein
MRSGCGRSRTAVVGVDRPDEDGLLFRQLPGQHLGQVVTKSPSSCWPAPRRPYYLRDRTDRARAYELILREGRPRDLLDYIDGVLLVDIWKELDLPDPIRRAWQPLIRNALPTRRRPPRATDSGGDRTPGALIRLRPSQRAQYLRSGQDVSDDQLGS